MLLAAGAGTGRGAACCAQDVILPHYKINVWFPSGCHSNATSADWHGLCSYTANANNRSGISRNDTVINAVDVGWNELLQRWQAQVPVRHQPSGPACVDASPLPRYFLSARACLGCLGAQSWASLERPRYSGS